jgi:hypothetical protein
MKSVRQVIQSNLDLICALTSYARGDGVFSSHHVLNDSVCGYASDAAALVLGLHDIVPQRVSVMCTGSTDHQLKGCNNHEYLLIGNEVLDMTYRQYAHTFE